MAEFYWRCSRTSACVFMLLWSRVGRQTGWKRKRNNLHFLWQKQHKQTRICSFTAVGCLFLLPRQCLTFSILTSHRPPPRFPAPSRLLPRPLSTDTEPLKLDGFTRKANVLKATAAIVCVSKETKLFFVLDQLCELQAVGPCRTEEEISCPEITF